MALSIPDDEAYALLAELWQAQAPGALEGGALTVSDAWLTRFAAALTADEPRVQSVICRATSDALELTAAVTTPVGAIEATLAVAPEVVQVGPDRRVVELCIVTPLKLTAGGLMGGLLGLLGGSAEALLAKGVAQVEGLSLDGDRLVADLSQIPRVEELCMRPWLGRPLCHYVQIVGCTVGAGGLVAHWRTGLDVSD